MPLFLNSPSEGMINIEVISSIEAAVKSYSLKKKKLLIYRVDTWEGWGDGHTLWYMVLTPALHLGITPDGLWEPYGIIGIKARLATCMQVKHPTHSSITPTQKWILKGLKKLTEGKAFALCTVDLGSIPGITCGSLSMPGYASL